MTRRNICRGNIFNFVYFNNGAVLWKKFFKSLEARKGIVFCSCVCPVRQKIHDNPHVPLELFMDFTWEIQHIKDRIAQIVLLFKNIYVLKLIVRIYYNSITTVM